MEKFINSVTDDTPMSSKMQRLLSLVFLVITVVMIFIPYTKIHTFFGFEVWESNLKILPSFISTFIAILLIAPLYARNILKWNKSIYTLISFVFFLLIFGSLIELAMGGNGLNSAIIQMIFILAIALSWLGIKAIAGICWMLLFIAVAFSAVWNSNIMGFNGFIYLASAFIGLVLHSELNPGNLVAGFKEEFRIPDEIQNAINTDINEAGNLAKQGANIVSKTI
ncbi:MAG: hypothetical protein U5K55_01065 [Aliarcobacter sp.]|nr:hypothetical protein [Aliarcobacter sp.]